MKRYRLIQYGAGNTGKFVLRSLLTHPQIELVGLGVHSTRHEGKDAGDICRLESTGIRATRNINALIASEADCVCFMPTDPHAGDVLDAGSHASSLFQLLCRFLVSGKNVIATAPNSLIYAHALAPEVVARLESACHAGGVSFLYVGVSPGFMPDRLVLNLTAVCTRIDSISVREIMNYGAYNDREMLFNFYGFGKRPEEFDRNALEQAFSRTLGGSVGMIADGLACKLSEIRTTVESATTGESVEIATGRIEVGSIAAQRIRATGIVSGNAKIVVEHITRVSDKAAPQWPRFTDAGHEGYCIAIHGAPSMNVDLQLGAFGRNPMADAGWAVAGHVANSVAALCEAEPGIRSFLDMPSARAAYRLSNS